MKSRIYYFSGTGNSLKIARDIAEGLGNADLAPVTEGLAHPPGRDADRIGIVFPVYMFRPPRIVMDFARALRTEATVFAVATFGGDAGDAYARIRRQLRAAGTRLSAAFGVCMPSNYAPYGGAIPREEQEAMFAAARAKVREIVAAVEAGTPHFEADGGFFSTKIHPGILYRLGWAMIPQMDKEFRAEESCNGCGTCVRVCPVRNVTLQDGRPVWRHGCQQCFACLQWCPKSAIQYGTKTQGLQRYHHPEVSAKDIATQGERLPAPLS